VPKLSITFASCPYDRLNPIISGRVPIEGCDVNFFPLRPEELFPRIYQTQDFDVTELSASSHILSRAYFVTATSTSEPITAFARRRICAARSSACRSIR